MAQTAEEALIVRMEATLTRFEKQMARGKQVADTVANGIEKRLGKMNDTIAKDAAASASYIGKEMDRLRAEYDPLFAASKRYEAEIEKINRAHKLGAITAGQQAAALDRLNKEYAEGAAGAGKMASGSILASNGARGMAQQLSQVAQQTMASGNFIQALAIQLPDMAMGFGAVGMAAGVLAGVALPLLYGMLFDTADGGKALEDQMAALSTAVDDYVSSVDAANAPQDVLIEKYGRMATEAQKALVAMSELAKVQGLQAMAATIDLVGQSLLEVQAVSAGAARAAGSRLGLIDDYGMAADQAERLRDALLALDHAEGLSAMAAAALTVNDALMSAFGSVEAMPAPLQEAYGHMAAIVDQASQMDAAVDASTTSMFEFVEAIYSGIGGMDGLISQTNSLAGAALTAAQNMWDFLGAKGAAQKAVDPKTFKMAGAYQLYASSRSAAPAVAPSAPKASRGGNGGGRGGGGGRAKTEEPFFGDLEGNLQKLEREIELLGRSTDQVATLKAKWELLDRAKERGLNLDAKQAGSSATLREQIDLQAESVGLLTAELEAQKISQDKFESAIDGIADAMARALGQGESLRAGLASVFQGIAQDLLKSGLKSMLSNLIGGVAGGGGGFFSKFAGAMMGKSFEGGGFTGVGSRAGGIDGRGGFPAVLHPNETVIDHTKRSGAQGGGHMTMTINVAGARGNAEIESMVKSGVQQGMAQVRRDVPSIMSDHQKRRG